MSLVYVISDCHFGHKGIERFRPTVQSVAENDYVILDNILTTCKKRDILWMLGDCFMTIESLNILSDIRSRVSQLHFVIGNHDTDRGRWNSVLSRAIENNMFTSVHGLAKMKGRAWLSHAPMHPLELWGKINIHGHVHLNTIPDGRYVNVCVDNTDMKPVKLQDIYAGWRGKDRHVYY
jgi:calcineurin-like phosphoesterase family protein